MADGEGEKELNKKERPCIIKTETSFPLDNFHLTLNELESELRRQGLSEFSSNEYCSRFCQALVQYAGSRNTQEHGAALLEVYRISIERFAVARPYLTTDCENVLLVVKRLALSCFELLLSLPDTELTRECWLCLHQSLQKAHATLTEYGNNDLLALLEITGAGGSWNNSILVRILAQMPYEQEEANAWISQEGPSFLELRVKHLIKIGTIPQAVLLAKLCSESDFITQKSMFRQTYISLLCSMLPSEEAISEISSIDCKEVLDIICNLEAEGQENTAFVLCTTYLTQQLQKESIYFSWELTLFWSKLQRRIDSSLDSFLERCRQFGSIAKTAYHLLFLVKVIQSEAEELGLAVSIELCVRAFQIPSQDDAETRSSLCKIVACLLSEDLEVSRVCQLTQFLLGPTQEAYDLLQELYLKPDQKYDEENCIIPNSLRCELLLALKALWPFDPEFWDWKTLKRHCQKLLGVDPSDESEPEEPSETEHHLLSGANTHVDISHSGESFLSDQQQQLDYYEEERVEKQQQKKDDLTLKKKKPVGTSERYQRWLQYKFLCVICSREVIEARILHHSKMHMVDGIFTCPVCLQKFEGKQAFMPHLAEHIRMPSRKNHRPQKKKKKKKIVKKLDDDDDDDDLDLEVGNLEPGDVRLDPNAPENGQNTLGLDPVLQTLTPRKLDESDHITFSYIDANFELRDRDIYPCPATDCVRIFKHFKYLSIHIKSEHSETDENIKHYMEMKDRRQKCTFCRRHFLTPFHHRQHRRVHYGPQPYMCVAVDCSARFSSTNELVSHKQSHGYQLSYQCELKGCSLKFSDLGQLYHHEAQHFRDAAYNCMQPGCKKFYFSKKEFAKHLSTHGISFTDEDLVAASKNKPALFGLVGDFPEVGAEGKSVEISAPQPESVNGPKSILEELINGIKKESTEISQLANSPASQTSSTGSNLTGTLTSVAVCFDGKTFTCGFEGCGLTFAVAKDIQKHLKLAHPLQFRKKGESSKNLCRGKIAARRVQHIKPPVIKQQSLGGQSSSLPSNASGQVTSFSPQINSVDPLAPHPSTSNEESLMEILIALSRLSLNTSNAASTSVLTSHPFSGSNVHVSSPFFAGASSPAKVIDSKTLFKSHRSNKPQQLRVPAVDGGLVSPSSFLSQLPEEEHKQLSQFLVQPNTKPYFCELKDCKFRSVTRSALLVHYLKKHNFPKEKVVGMKMFHSKFRPFKCHLCPRCFTRKSQLRVHLMDKHDLSKSLVAQMSCSEKRRAREEANMVRKPSGCLDLQGNVTEKTEQQPPAGVQSQGSVCPQKCSNHNRWPWITKSEWDNSIQGEEEEEDEDEEDDEDDGEAEEDEDETDGTGKPSISEDNGEESHEGRGSRRLVAKGNLCYILTKYHKPFHCVHKDCSSAFTNQNGLVRHLQSVHRYNRNQLSLEEDLQQIEGNKKDLAKHKGRPCKHKACDKRFHTDESLSAENLQLQNLDQDLPALKAPGLQTPASEEPIPQFSCSYTNCSASYHLYSSLVRHIRLFHKGQFTKPNDPRSHHRCTFDGCARVFSNADNLKQHIFFRHWEHYDSFVFGLKNKKESDENNDVQNFKKKPPEIGVPETRTPKGERHSDRSVTQTRKVRTSSLVMTSRKIIRRRKETLMFRTPEEALQMCQDRCFSVAFPCMVQDCESVVTLESSLIRHYKRCHDMVPSYIAGKYKDLVNNAEKLEEIIQTKSAASAVSSNEVCTSALADGKDEQKTLEISPLGTELQICLSPIKPKPDEEVDHLDFEGDVPSNKLLMDADALLYGEVVKNGCMSEQVKRSVHEPDKKSKPDPLSSTPTTLFYKKDEGFVDYTNTGTVSFSTPSRPPLKRKNEQEDPHFSPSIGNQQCHLSNNRGSQPKTFDLKAYKPMGFESSFLKFIQESNDKDDDCEETSQWDPCLSDAQLVTKRKDAYRRACAVKENNQTGMGLVRGKTASLVHGKLTDFQPMLSAEESATVQNLKSILDKALTDCGDLALKQLHYLKPVVVLERPKFPKSLLDLLPTKKTNEFCVGSS